MRISGAIGAAVLVACVAGLSAEAPGAKADAQGIKSAAGNPVIVIDTVKGNIEIELFAKDAPKSVARLLTLVRENFYRGLRFHRVEPGFLVQIGDPATRDFRKRNIWGSGGSGQSIGVAEIAKQRRHVRGAVGLAHSGRPERADSQFYIMRGARPALDGKYAIVGRVISGMDVVDKLALTDMVRKVSVKGEVPQP